MTRETSIEAYHQIKDEGILSKLRWQIYEYVFKNGPVSIRDAARHFKGQYSNSLSTRFSELRDMGVFKEVGKKIDEQTGRSVLIWDVTKKLPIKLEKKTEQCCPTCKGTGKITSQQARLF
jgi:uncharacterized protein YwgA